MESCLEPVSNGEKIVAKLDCIDARRGCCGERLFSALEMRLGLRLTSCGFAHSARRSLHFGCTGRQPRPLPTGTLAVLLLTVILRIMPRTSQAWLPSYVCLRYNRRRVSHGRCCPTAALGGRVRRIYQRRVASRCIRVLSIGSAPRGSRFRDGGILEVTPHLLVRVVGTRRLHGGNLDDRRPLLSPG